MLISPLLFPPVSVFKVMGAGERPVQSVMSSLFCLCDGCAAAGTSHGYP